MPSLACYACGRRMFATAPFESLFAEERRCPRCGALMNIDRRQANRRTFNRRENSTDEPGPPLEGERRDSDRRRAQRRRPTD